MGCTASLPKRYGNARRRRRKGRKIPEVVVFVPGLRVPVAVELRQGLGGLVRKEVVDRMVELRSRIALFAHENVLGTVDGLLEVQKAIGEYLPFLIGLTRKEHRLEALVEFKWRSSADNGRETCLASAWYELLSVLHMMAILSLMEANLLLLPKDRANESSRNVSEDPKKMAIDLLLKASGCLEYCVKHVLLNFPMHIRVHLPSDLEEGVLEAISILLLAQGVELQLGLAMECEQATLAVKRRLACEQVTYLSQAHYCLSGCNYNETQGKKLLLFLKYKFLEAKAAAYYYHGLILGKGNTPSDRISSVCCHFTADELLMESKRVCLSFCLAPPISRVPPAWGPMKHLQKKIPETASKKSAMYGDLLCQDKAFQTLPELPEFPLSLKPDKCELPEIDPSWDGENYQSAIQMLKVHLKDEEDTSPGPDEDSEQNNS